MGWGIRILMGIIILVVLGFSIFFLVLTSVSQERCVSTLTEDGKSMTEAQQSCQDIENMKGNRWIVLGVCGAIILICVIVFIVKKD